MGTHAIAISSAWEPAWASSAAGGKGAAVAVAKAARRRGLKRRSARVPAARASLRGGLIVVVAAAARIADQLQLAQRRGHLQPRPSHHHAHEPGHCCTSTAGRRGGRAHPTIPHKKTVGRLRSTVQGGTMIYRGKWQLGRRLLHGGWVCGTQLRGCPHNFPAISVNVIGSI